MILNYRSETKRLQYRASTIDSLLAYRINTRINCNCNIRKTNSDDDEKDLGET